MSIANTGNADIDVSLSTAPPFGVSAGPVHVPANATVTIAVSYVPDPTTLGFPQSGALGITTSDVVCSPLPPSLSLAGTPTDAATTIALGGYASCATGNGGTLYCWGNNSYGTLGNGGKLPSGVPSVSKAIGVTKLGGTLDDVLRCRERQGSVLGRWRWRCIRQQQQSRFRQQPVIVYGLTTATRSSRAADGVV